MGGLAYVNTGYLILNSKIIPKEHKEACMNLSLCLNNFGVLIAACFCLILDNFIISK
jgi:CLN3 protein.